MPHLTVIAILAAAAHAQPARQIGPEELTDEHVQRAIEAIAAELADRMNERTFWEPERLPSGEAAQPGGYTALAALALLSAGESYQGPRLRDAVEHLRDSEMKAVYGLAARASLWAGLPARFHSNLESDSRLLINGFQRDGRGWFYNVDGPPIWLSNSRRMFGALGLWEAANRGVNVPRTVWQQLEEVFLELQLADGGWNYRGDGPATASMTAAGLATLFITQDHLHANRFVALSAGARARRQPPHPADLAIERGLQWMERNFSASENVGITARAVRAHYFYYYLYSVERAALASGYRHFGGHDWFREGAAELIHRFCRWDEESRTMTANRTTYGDGRRAALRTDDLAFGLMFLSRGRVPIAVNKLRDDSVAWNNRPRDVANFTAWLREESATELNWQIVDLQSEPESWLDAPLLYFASNEGVPWATAGSPELAKLKRYLDLGGMLLAVSEGTGRQFADSIERAGRLMYPHLQWRTLEVDDWAFAAHFSVDRARPRLRALSNGVRDLVILSTDDLSATFQSRRGQPTAHYETIANVYVLASEMNRPKPRLSAQSPATLIDDVKPAGNISANIVRAFRGFRGRDGSDRHWHPEPLALEVFAAALSRAGDLSMTIDEHPLERIHELSPRANLVFISGAGDGSLSTAQREAMRRFVEAGGVILVEEAGGSPSGSFARDIETAAAEFLGEPVRPLRDHPIITGEEIDCAIDLSRVEYRPYSITITGSIETLPRLRGIVHAGGGAILLSREDISHGLLDQPAWGIHGYSPRSARLLLRNILLYAAR